MTDEQAQILNERIAREQRFEAAGICTHKWGDDEHCLDCGAIGTLSERQLERMAFKHMTTDAAHRWLALYVLPRKPGEFRFKLRK